MKCVCVFVCVCVCVCVCVFVCGAAQLSSVGTPLSIRVHEGVLLAVVNSVYGGTPVTITLFTGVCTCICDFATATASAGLELGQMFAVDLSVVDSILNFSVSTANVTVSQSFVLNASWSVGDAQFWEIGARRLRCMAVRSLLTVQVPTVRITASALCRAAEWRCRTSARRARALSPLPLAAVDRTPLCCAVLWCAVLCCAVCACRCDIRADHIAAHRYTVVETDRRAVNCCPDLCQDHSAPGADISRPEFVPTAAASVVELRPLHHHHRPHRLHEQLLLCGQLHRRDVVLVPVRRQRGERVDLSTHHDSLDSVQRDDRAAELVGAGVCRGQRRSLCARVCRCRWPC